jgi:predicted AlkP superfamily phosphohydrolase/phosphomutase
MRNNQYVRLVEALNLKFSDIIKNLPTSVNEEDVEYNDRTIELAKVIAYIYAWNGVAHSINDSARQKKFGIVNGEPTKIADYNLARKRLRNALDDDEQTDDLLTASAIANKFYDESRDKIANIMINGQDLKKFSFEDLLDVDINKKPDILKFHQTLVTDFYTHNGQEA